MNPDNGAWICFVCDARGRADVDVTPSSVLDSLQPVTRREWPEVMLPDFTKLSRTGRKYLADRGIHRPEQFGIVELADAPRVLIPYRGHMGQVIYWATRRFMDDGLPKYITATGRKPLYVLPDWSPHSHAVVVEGVFDCIAYHLATGNSAIALGGKSLARYNRSDLNLLAPGKRKVMLDGDAMGQAVKLSREIGASITMLPAGVDPADYYKEK